MSASNIDSGTTGPSSTLVNIAEHAEVRLIELLAGTATSRTFKADCESCIKFAEAARLIRTVVRDGGAVSALFESITLEDAVSAFSLLAALLDRVEGESASKVAMELADAVVACAKKGDNAVDNARKRAAMLCTLYNLRSGGRDKCRLLAKIVSLCATSLPDLLRDAHGGVGSLVSDPDHVVRLLDSWDVPTEDRRTLLKALTNSDGDEKNGNNRQRFLLLLLDTYKGPINSLQKDKEVMTIAANAAIGAIKDPVTLFVEQRGMLSLPAIMALKTKSASLYALLEIFQEAKLSDFQSFLTKHPSSLLSSHNLTLESCTRHMRILSLCSLAAEYEDEIPYSAIAQTLDVNEAEVESWVIAAVASGLLVAKMDQLQQVVMVERCVVRKFGLEQWKAMQTKINAWKKNVKHVLDGLKQTSSLQQQN